MKATLRRQIEAACAKALETPSAVFVDAPGPRPSGGCESCGEVRPIVERTGMCEECTEIAYQFYPETRP